MCGRLQTQTRRPLQDSAGAIRKRLLGEDEGAETRFSYGWAHVAEHAAADGCWYEGLAFRPPALRTAAGFGQLLLKWTHSPAGKPPTSKQGLEDPPGHETPWHYSHFRSIPVTVHHLPGLGQPIRVPRVQADVLRPTNRGGEYKFSKSVRQPFSSATRTMLFHRYGIRPTPWKPTTRKPFASKSSVSVARLQNLM